MNAWIRPVEDGTWPIFTLCENAGSGPSEVPR